MKIKILNYSILFVMMLFAQQVFAQSAKKFYKSGMNYNKQGNYELAIEQFSKAIEMDQSFVKAFEARAFAYEQLNDLKNAASDYVSLSELLPKDYQNAFKAAKLFFKTGDFKHAAELAVTADELAPTMPEIKLLNAKCLYAIKDYKNALESADKTLQLIKTPENYYVRGLIQTELKDYAAAESDFNEAVKLKPDFTDALVHRASTLMELKRQPEALQLLNNAIGKDNKNKNAYLMRSKINMENADYKSTIDDLTKVMSFDSDPEVIYMRGFAYSQNKQYPEAIDDFSKAIQLKKDHYQAIEGRANCYQKINKKEQAAKDYAVLAAIQGNSKEDKELRERAKMHLLELKKETNLPKIMISGTEKSDPKALEIPDGMDFINIQIKVLDESNIKHVFVNKGPVNFNQDSIGIGQYFKINIRNKTTLEIEAEDIYQNKSSIVVKLIRKDEGAIKIALISPVSAGNGFVFLNSFEPVITLEGRILDNNLVDSIAVNGMPVYFDKQVKNPSFKMKIDVSAIDKLSFFVSDNSGAILEKEFMIDRSDAALLNDNPMGRTWVVFVENSEYKNFSNLEGPKKEIDLMIKALSKYRIDRIIHKRNLTKAQMESFFSYELKNLIIENRVNSLLIWYAGHGKSTGQAGFWVPVDSKVDDVAGYFNINTLKTSIKPYIQYVTHSLIVTDACETGPTFYMSMRTLSSERKCSDTKATKFKSSQVFASSGYDLADGDSEFTKSFANSLMFDSDNCVPIERIVNKVSSAVTKSNNKKPKFGKINGFEDENGTFIFIKK